MTKLTDLPEQLLVRIAANVSEAPPVTCDKNDYQVVCERSHWRKLNAFRATCRTLRNAARLAVGGLANFFVIGLGEERTSYVFREDAMPLVTAQELPRLRELCNVYGKGACTLIQTNSSVLNHSELQLDCLSYSRASNAEFALALICDAVGQSRLEKLRVVRLSAVDPLLVKIFFKSIGKSLRELYLSYCSSHTPTLPADAVQCMTVVELSNCVKVDKICAQLSASSKLNRLVLCECTVKDKKNLEQLLRLTNAVELEYGMLEYGMLKEDGSSMDSALAKVVAAGALGRLTSLRYTFRDSADALQVHTMLRQLSRQLQKVELLCTAPLTPTTMRFCEGLQFPKALEVHFTICAKAIYDFQKLEYLLAFPALTHLTLVGYDDIVDLSKLANLPKLRSVDLRACFLMRNNLPMLLQKFPCLFEFTVYNCIDAGTDRHFVAAGVKNYLLNSEGSQNFCIEEVGRRVIKARRLYPTQ